MTKTAVRSIVSTPSNREIRIERVFDAPRDRVWRALTEPELIAQWWGRGQKVIVERMEVTRGGHWRFVVHVHTTEERDGMLQSGMEAGINDSHAALDLLLERLAR